jgi:hypothetical protein
MEQISCCKQKVLCKYLLLFFPEYIHPCIIKCTNDSHDAGAEHETAQDLAAKEGEWAVVEVLLARSLPGAVAKEPAGSHCSPVAGHTTALCIREAAALVWLAMKGTESAGAA